MQQTVGKYLCVNKTYYFLVRPFLSQLNTDGEGEDFSFL